MDQPNLCTLPNEIIDILSHQLNGIDLFHFTLLFRFHLNITNYQLQKLLHRQSTYLLTDETKSLLRMSNSPYMMPEEDITLILSSLKWNTFVYGSFKLEIIEKSLKYFFTTMFSLYCRMWSFTPFHYQSSYPTLDIFEYSRMIFIIF